MANQLGKRLACQTCNAQVVVTKPGQGELECCEKVMVPVEAKKLPSSD